MLVTRQGANDVMTPESIQAMIDWAIQRNSTHTQDDASHNSGEGLRRPVQPATCAAQTWWNGHVRTLGHDAAYTMTWGTLKKKLKDKYYPKGEIKKLKIELFLADEIEKVDKYISGLPDNIHGNVMSARPKTLNDAIELANDLMDQKLRTYAERQAQVKIRLYTGNLPLCTSAITTYTRQCAPSEENAKGSCYECGNTGHIKKNCPKLKNRRNGNGNGTAQGRAYALGGRDNSPDSNVIMCMFLLNNRYATILFDTKLADGKIIGVNTIYYICTLNFHAPTRSNSDLMSIPLGSFDVIIGMDWLTKYHGVIICDEKIARVPSGRKMLIFQSNGNNQREES
ncbi:putative reverse transcriptase domain-containing protein [Tanacetum coccineum]